MTVSASKNFIKPSRSPAVTFSLTGSGLSIRVVMPPDKAKAIVETVAKKARAKSTASKAVLAALRDLTNEERRDRSGFIQADIPTELKAQLVSVALTKEKTVTSMVFNKLATWIDPVSGERRTIKAKNGGRTRVGPKSFRIYVQTKWPVAAKPNPKSRLQVEVGDKITRYLKRILAPNRITMSQFLATLVQDIITENGFEKIEESVSKD